MSPLSEYFHINYSRRSDELLWWFVRYLYLHKPSTRHTARIFISLCPSLYLILAKFLSFPNFAIQQKLNQTFDLSKYIIGQVSFLSIAINFCCSTTALCEVSLVSRDLNIPSNRSGLDWSPLWIVGSLAPGSLATTWTRAGGGNCNYSSRPATPALPARRPPLTINNHHPASHSSTTATATKATTRKCIGNPGRVSSYYQEMAWSSLLYCTQSKRSRRKIPRDQSKIIWIALLSSELHLNTEKLLGPGKNISLISSFKSSARSFDNTYKSFMYHSSIHFGPFNHS